MTAILRGGEIVGDDWTVVEDGRTELATGGGKVIVTLARWRAERDALLAAHTAVGVLVPNTADIEAVYTEIADRALIALQFPTFTDGELCRRLWCCARGWGFEGNCGLWGISSGIWCFGWGGVGLRASCLGRIRIWRAAGRRWGS